MRIISILLPNLHGGGAERLSLTLAQGFRERGYVVDIVVMKAEGSLLEEASKHHPVFELVCAKMREVPHKLAQYIRRRRPSSMIANMWPLTTMAVIGKMLSRHRFHLMLVEHCSLASQYQDWGLVNKVKLKFSIASTFRFADSIIGVSKGVSEEISNCARVHDDAVSTIYNAIPLPRPLCDAEVQSAVGAWRGGDGHRVLSVGTLKGSKNHRLLLEAFAKVKNKNSKLMLLGDGEERPRLMGQAKALDIDDRVIFQGFVIDPVPFYRTAHLFVLSSDYEGFGNVLVEALGAGVSVVSTDCPTGPAEILEYGRWGQLTPVGDASALTQAIDHGLEHPWPRDDLIKRASQFVPTIAVDRYLSIMKLPLTA